MLGFLYDSLKAKAYGRYQTTMFQKISSPLLNEITRFGPFNCDMQKRWRKPADTAQTRLESRTRDLQLDKLINQIKKLKIVLKVHELISKQRGRFLSVQLLSTLKNVIGLNTEIGSFLRRYPHIFELYIHPVKRNLCCKITQKMGDLIAEEARIIRDSEFDAVQRLKKLLMISTNGALHIHALWLVRRELGLPNDFRYSILPNYQDDLEMVSPDMISLVSKDESLAEAKVERWREKEYLEKWLSEFETKYAFPIRFPTGFEIERGFREKLKNWQRLPYLKPYENKEVVRVHTCSGTERFEKRAVGILHEFLSLTVEKMVPVERLSHFRKDFNMEVNLRELLLKHPGIFYISTKGDIQTVFLRDAYSKACLIEANPVYSVRRKMLDLIVLGRRNTNDMRPLEELEERCNEVLSPQLAVGSCDGDWVIPILENCDEQTCSRKTLEHEGLI